MERILFQAPSAIDEFHTTPDGSLWVAVLFGSTGTSRVFASGQDIGSFDAVQEVVFSPDGKHVAFKSENSRRQCAVLDGKPGELYLEVNDLLFGPRGLLFRAEVFGKHFVVDAGVEGAKYDEIAGLTLAPDGRVAFAARKEKEWFQVVGGLEKAKFDRVGRPIFGGGGTRFAHTAMKKGKSFIVLDDTPLAPNDIVGEPVFSPEGDRIAYTAEKDEDAYVTIGDQTHGPYSKAETPVFGPGGRTAFLYQREGTTWLWEDGKELGPYEVAAYPTFGSDGSLYLVAEFNGKRILLLDGNPASDPFDEILGIELDAGSRSVGFSAREGRQRFVVVNGQRQKPYDLVEGLELIPPSSFWFRAKIGRQWRAVIGNREEPLYDTVGLLQVAPDRTHVVYKATRGTQALLVQSSLTC